MRWFVFFSLSPHRLPTSRDSSSASAFFLSAGRDPSLFEFVGLSRNQDSVNHVWSSKQRVPAYFAGVAWCLSSTLPSLRWKIEGIMVRHSVEGIVNEIVVASPI